MLNQKANLNILKQSCENFVLLSDKYSLDIYIEMAKKLNIKILVIDDLNIEERENFIKKMVNIAGIKLLTPSEIFSIEELSLFEKDLLFNLKDYKLKLDDNILLISRKTFATDKLKFLKKELGHVRRNYEIISVKSRDKNTLKWAAHDRRVDFLSFSVGENFFLDSALCSLVKQHNKVVEIILEPLLHFKNQKELTATIRYGKKLMRNIITSNIPFIFTVKSSSPFHLRTGIQQRYLGELLGVPFNKSSKAIFDIQLSIILKNLMKLSENHIIEGVKEVK